MTQQEVIKAFNQSLNNTNLSGRAALDEAVQASSDFSNYQEVANKFIEDQRAATNWHRFLVEKCGIILDNADTGAISGSDAGSGIEKTKTTIIPCEGDASYPSGSSFTVDGLTIYGIPAKSRLTEAQQYVVQGLYSWWIRDSLALIKESYGYSFTDVNTTNSRLKLKFVNDTEGEYKGTLAYVSFDAEDGKSFESRVLCVNMAWFNDADLTDRHGTIEYGLQLDRTLVHELVHGLMASNVNYFCDLPNFLLEGGTAELIHGIDDERYEDIINVALDTDTFRKILTPTYVDSVNEVYTGGYIFMRYYAKQASDVTFDYDTYHANVAVDDNGFATNYWDKVNMTGSDAEDTITNSGEDVYIVAGAAADVVKNYAAGTTIDAGDGDDSVINDGAEVSIISGAGKDSITSTAKDVTIIGSTGENVITNTGAYSSIVGGDSADMIVNNVSGYETLDVINASFIESGIVTGNDAIVLIANGNSTLQAFSANVTGGNGSSVYGDAGDDNISNYATKARVYGEEGADIITNFGIQATVYGGTDDDTISNAKAEVSMSAADFEADGKGIVQVEGYKARIYGGDGNDSIINACNDVRVYGQNGADSVTNTGLNVSVYGGADADYVENAGGKAFISLGAGDDAIDNYADEVKALGGAGNDTFMNDSTDSTLIGDAGNDEFLNYGDYNSINGGAGNDTIYSSGAAASLNGGANDDYIYNEGVNAYLLGGAGNDTLYNEGDHITISAGAGDDYIENNGGKYIHCNFSKTSGNDTLVGLNTDDTIQITKGTYSASQSGNDVIVKVGNSALTLTNAADKTFYVITSANKTETVSFDPITQTVTDDDEANQTIGAGVTIFNASARTTAIKITGNALANTVLGGSKNDTIYGNDGDDLIGGNAGADRLYGQNGNDSLLGNAGNDKLYGQDGRDLLYGEAGKDTLSGGAGNDSLWGGAGNDTLTGGDGDDLFIYSPNEGTDTITDYQSGELVAILDSTFTAAVFDTNKLTLTIDGGGSLIFNNVTTSTAFNINNTYYHVSGDTIK